MSQDKRTLSAEKFFRRLVTHGRNKRKTRRNLTQIPARGSPHSTWVIFKDSSYAGTECQWCGISYLRWAFLPRRASCLGGWSVATSRRAADHHCRRLARRVIPWTRRQPRRCPTLQARLLS